MKDVSPSEVHRSLEGANPPLLLDVREPWEWELVHVDGATLMPMNTVPSCLDQIPRDRSVAVMCHHGVRSRQVAIYLVQQGFTDVINVGGGIDAWAVDVDATLARY